MRIQGVPEYLGRDPETGDALFHISRRLVDREGTPEGQLVQACENAIRRAEAAEREAAKLSAKLAEYDGMMTRAEVLTIYGQHHAKRNVPGFEQGTSWSTDTLCRVLCGGRHDTTHKELLHELALAENAERKLVAQFGYVAKLDLEGSIWHICDEEPEVTPWKSYIVWTVCSQHPALGWWAHKQVLEDGDRFCRECERRSQSPP